MLKSVQHLGPDSAAPLPLFRSEETNMILFRGPPGSGKTTKAAELAAHYLKTGCKVAHFEADDYFYKGPNRSYNFDPSQLYQAHKSCRDRTEKLSS